MNPIQPDLSSSRLKMLGWLFVLIATIVFGALAFAAHQVPYFDFDLAMARAIQSIHVAGFDSLMTFVNWFGYPPEVYGVLAVILVIMFFYVSRWAAIVELLTTLIVGVVGLGIKILVDRPRPDPALIHVVNPHLDGGKFSFTAGHVQVYMVVFGFIWFLALVSPKSSWKRALMLVFFGFLIAAIGVGRIYSGEHWFSDVIGGYLFGSIWLVLTVYFYRWGENRFFAPSQHTPKRSPAPFEGLAE